MWGAGELDFVFIKLFTGKKGELLRPLSLKELMLTLQERFFCSFSLFCFFVGAKTDFKLIYCNKNK